MEAGASKKYPAIKFIGGSLFIALIIFLLFYRLYEFPSL